MANAPSCARNRTGLLRGKMPTATVLACIVAVSGCSVDDHGSVRVHYTQTDTYQMRHAVAKGLHIQTRGPLVGLSLGRVETLNVHLKSCNGLEPRFHYQNAQGIQLTISQHEIGLTLGVRETLISAPGGANTASALHFSADHPEDTTVAVHPTALPPCHTKTSRDTLS